MKSKLFKILLIVVAAYLFIPAVREFIKGMFTEEGPVRKTLKAIFKGSVTETKNTEAVAQETNQL